MKESKSAREWKGARIDKLDRLNISNWQTVRRFAVKVANLTFTAVFSLIVSESGHAAVLQSWAGPTVVTGGGIGTLLVNTTTDTGNWINSHGDYSSGTATVPLYFSFTLSVTNNTGETGSGGFFTSFELAMGFPNNVANERLAIGNNSSSVNWSGFQSGTGGGDFNLNANVGVGGVNPITPTETASFILKLDQSTNTATIWFNPNTGLSESSQDIGLTTVVSGLGIEDTFDGVWLRAGLGTGSTTFSAMSVRDDTPFAAIPEPSIVLMASPGLSFILIFRRRSKDRTENSSED